MSVINKMLKDLDERQAQPQAGMHATAPVTVKKNAWPLTAAIIILVILLIAVSWFAYQQMQQNQSTVNEAQVQESALRNDIQALAGSIEQLKQSSADQTEQNKQLQQSLSQQKTELQTAEQEKVAQQQSQTQLQQGAPSVPTSLEVAEKNTSVVAEESSSNSLATIAEETTAVQSKPAIEKKQVPTIVNRTSREEEESSGSLSISSRKMSGKELAAQKLVKAEKALQQNNSPLAEQYLEEVLLVEPSNKKARQKLATLLFARQAYREAINITAQGIALDTQDLNFRMLKSQIHLAQSDMTRAYATLAPLANVNNIEYQVQLANIAQGVNKPQAAIDAYQTLISMQPKAGKWYLGKAIVHDKQAQYALASQAYKQALAQENLAKASADFVQKRLKDLGE